MFATHDTWFITCRTFQARKLMTPTSPRVRDICGGVLAKAVALTSVRLHAYVFLSNHLHLIVHGQGPRIATFMKYLLGNLSKKLAPVTRPAWWNRFWERRYTATPILDEPALEDRLRYVLAHGVKEGLVARAAEWEGLHCATQLLDEQPRCFSWFNWTKRWQARQHKDGVSLPREKRFAESIREVVTLELAPLPQWAHEPPERRRRRMRELISDIERTQAPPRPPLGVEAIRRQTTERSWRRKRTTAPHCHASTTQARAAFMELYTTFRNVFREASVRWLAGDRHARFPPGAFKPYVYEIRVE